MKKTLLAMLVCVAMLAVVAFPVFAAEPTEWVIPTYTVPTVNDNEVVVDGVMDEAYFKGQKIEGNTDEQRYDRKTGDDGVATSDEVKARSDGSFTTYMLASEKGLYVYAEINDTTMKPGKLDSDSETGDAFHRSTLIGYRTTSSIRNRQTEAISRTPLTNRSMRSRLPVRCSWVG